MEPIRHTLFTIARLADNLGEQQCWTEADELTRTAVEHATTALGAEHEATLSCRLTLARVPYRTVPHESEDFIRATVRDIVAVPGDGPPWWNSCMSWAGPTKQNPRPTH